MVCIETAEMVYGTGAYVEINDRKGGSFLNFVPELHSFSRGRGGGEGGALPYKILGLFSLGIEGN